MEQSFLLKQYGNIDLLEQGSMTGEERVWWLKRLDDENKRTKKQSSADQLPPGKLPQSPGQPPA